MSELGKCPTCGGQVSTTAGFCPHCGETLFYRDVFDRVVVKNGRRVRERGNVDARTGKDNIICSEESEEIEGHISFLGTVLGLAALVAIIFWIGRTIGFW